MGGLIGGRRPVAEALAAGRSAERLLVAVHTRPSPELRAILTGAQRAGIPIETLPGDALGRLAGFEGPQGGLLEGAGRPAAEAGNELA